MSYSQISLTDVAREVLRLADADPTHVYEKAEAIRTGDMPESTGTACFYVPGEHRHPNDDKIRVTAPEGCLFGQAITNLGVTNADLGAWEGLPVEEVLSNLGIQPTTLDEETVLSTFSDVQSAQDGGTPWGDATEALRSVLS